MTRSVVERYLRLGLELGRHVEGIVDAYYGPPELADAVDAEPQVDPRSLVSAAELLLDELERRRIASVIELYTRTKTGRGIRG